MPPPDLPPHPGPRPHPFEFPFTEAQAALAEIEACASEVGDTIDRHDSAVGPLRIDFEGETRSSFDRAFEQLLGEVDDGQRGLLTQRDGLQDAIDEARRLREASLDAIDEHDADLRGYEDAREDAGG